ncbi:MAG TPA: hypothetical protein VGE38_02300 [Nocardioides sp.]
MVSTAVRLHEATAEHTESINHWVVGGISLVLLMAALLGLIWFGAGREHS